MDHRDIGLQNDAELVRAISIVRLMIALHNIIAFDVFIIQAPAYQAMSEVIKSGCKAAIWLSERV